MRTKSERRSVAGWLLDPYDLWLAVAICLALIVATVAATISLMHFPAFPAARLGAEPGNAQVILKWTDRGNYDSWQYRQGGAMRDFNEWLPVPDGCLSESCVVGGLTNGREYYFQVRGVREKLTGPPSNLAVATPTKLPDRIKSIEDIVVRIDERVAEIATAIGRANELCAGDMVKIGAIYFAHDSDALTDSNDAFVCASNRESFPRFVSELSSKCHEDPNGLVILEGNASATGPPSYNLDLSQRRTEAVERKLNGTESEKSIDCDFVSIARGENHDRAIPTRDEHCDRNVQVFWCGASAVAELEEDSARGNVAPEER